MKKLIAILFMLSAFLNGYAQKQGTIKLKKIIYHSSACFGTCPAYQLEIDKSRKVKLHIQIAFKSTGRIIDSTKIGYYTGKLSSADYTKLLNEIAGAGIDTLTFPNTMCCDGVVTTLIVYYNGKRKFLKSMMPPKEAKSLIDYLFSICESKSLVKTTQKFVIEDSDAK